MQYIIELLTVYGLLILLILILVFILKEIVKAWIWSTMLRKITKYNAKQIAKELRSMIDHRNEPSRLDDELDTK